MPKSMGRATGKGLAGACLGVVAVLGYPAIVHATETATTPPNWCADASDPRPQYADVCSRMAKIVSEHLGVDKEKVVAGASFIDDLGADSLDAVELVMAAEEEFGISINDDDASKIVTVSDAIEVVLKSGYKESRSQPATLRGALG